MTLREPLAPVHNSVLKVASYARRSTENQQEATLPNQHALNIEFLGKHYPAPYELVKFEETVSGLDTDRKEFRKITCMIRDQVIDVLIVHECSRASRHFKQTMDLFYLCKDTKVRLLGVSDGFDSYDQNAEFSMVFSGLNNQDYVLRGSRSIKDKKKQHFLNGYDLPSLPPGYTKPEGTRHENDVSKDERYLDVIPKLFDMYLDGYNISQLAHWLNEKNIPTGPSARVDRWDQAKVKRLLTNEIYKGERIHNKTETDLNFSSGKFKSQKVDSKKWLKREVPHLAYVTTEKFDEVNRLIKERGEKFRRGKQGKDPIKGRPRKSTSFTAQHSRCGVCGRRMTKNLMGGVNRMYCQGAGKYNCWNALSYDLDKAVPRILDAIWPEIESIPEFDPLFKEEVERQIKTAMKEQNQELKNVQIKVSEVEKKIKALLDVLERGSGSSSLAERLDLYEDELKQLNLRVQELEKVPDQVIEIPDLDEMKSKARELAKSFAMNDPVFQQAMKEIMPEIVIVPCHIIGEQSPVSFAAIRLHMCNWLNSSQAKSEYLQEHLTKDLWIMLDDAPKHIQIIDDVVAMTEQGMYQRDIAKALGTHQATVQRSLVVHRRMVDAGVTSPYVPVVDPDESTSLKRHKHKGFKFIPLDSVEELRRSVGLD